MPISGLPHFTKFRNYSYNDYDLQKPPTHETFYIEKKIVKNYKENNVYSILDNDDDYFKITVNISNYNRLLKITKLKNNNNIIIDTVEFYKLNNITKLNHYYD